VKFRPFALFVIAASSTFFLISAQTGNGPGTETITIERDAPAHPFPHMWEQAFGSGRAVLTLRQSYRDDLKAVNAGGAPPLRYSRMSRQKIVYKDIKFS
jgi:hypothetical protein